MAKMRIVGVEARVWIIPLKGTPLLSRPPHPHRALSRSQSLLQKTLRPDRPRSLPLVRRNRK